MSQGITIYTTQYCPYCIRARNLLDAKGVAYQDIAVDHDQQLRREMMMRSGRSTVPQIWIGEQHIGGCDEMMLLERQGRLDEMLARVGAAP
jgi:glutaredoxin 3